MAIDSNKSFEVSEDGLTIDSGTGIWIGGGDAVPTHNAPEGSRYFRTSPEEQYIQEGPGNTNNWVLLVSAPEGAGLGGIRVNFWHDSGTENQWLQVDTNHTEMSGPSTDTKSEPYVFPFNGTVTSLVYMNKNVDTGSDVELYKNGVLLFTFQVRNKKWVSKTNGLSAVTFSAGDRLSIFAKKVTGQTKPDDLLIDVYIAFTSSTEQELSGVAP